MNLKKIHHKLKGLEHTQEETKLASWWPQMELRGTKNHLDLGPMHIWCEYKENQLKTLQSAHKKKTYLAP